MIETAVLVTGRDVPVTISPRRPGNPLELVVDPTLARRELGWVPQHSDLETVFKTAGAWEQNRRF